MWLSKKITTTLASIAKKKKTSGDFVCYECAQTRERRTAASQFPPIRLLDHRGGIVLGRTPTPVVAVEVFVTRTSACGREH